MPAEQTFVTLPLLEPQLLRVIDTALQEDLGMGDVTTDNLIDPSWQAKGVFYAKDEGVLAGIPVAAAIFRRVDPAIVFTPLLNDGDRVARGDLIGRMAGPAASILRAERVALNFMQRLSGVATMTARYVAEVRDLPVRITETRKTTPGLRSLEKYAVRVGGGHNHRQNLADGVLIKDNHLEALALAGFSITDAINQCKARVTHMVRIEVEVTSLEQAREAAEAGVDWILLDNMPPERMREAVGIIAGRAKVEASGGVTLENLRAVAEAGVDLVSAGALTHSYRALDISVELNYKLKG
ncbi:MAG: carboxylating nicotinate-nucleotide diphosphorylase [Dehalococcoidia bacterium]|nr:carboxylating nicotinate-nucleotide diphosphorylase [Dehalococcoidia bacterium]